MERKKEEILNSGLLEQYVLGLLEKEEVAEVEEILEQYPELWNYVRDLKVTLTAVSFQNGVRPATKRNENGPLPETPVSRPVLANKTKNKSLNWFSWAMLIMLAGVNIFLAINYDGLHKRYSQLEHKYSSVSTQLDHLQTEHSLNEFLVNSKTRKQEISGEYKDGEYSSWVFINDDHEKMYWQMGVLPELGNGHCFRIWANVKGNMVSVGPPLRHHHDMVELDYHPLAESFHITMEKKSGVSHPNTDQLIASGPSGINQ